MQRGDDAVLAEISLGAVFVRRGAARRKRLSGAQGPDCLAYPPKPNPPGAGARRTCTSAATGAKGGEPAGLGMMVAMLVAAGICVLSGASPSAIAGQGGWAGMICAMRAASSAPGRTCTSRPLAQRQPGGGEGCGECRESARIARPQPRLGERAGMRACRWRRAAGRSAPPRLGRRSCGAGAIDAGSAMAARMRSMHGGGASPGRPIALATFSMMVVPDRPVRAIETATTGPVLEVAGISSAPTAALTAARAAPDHRRRDRGARRPDRWPPKARAAHQPIISWSLRRAGEGRSLARPPSPAARDGSAFSRPYGSCAGSSGRRLSGANNRNHDPWACAGSPRGSHRAAGRRRRWRARARADRPHPPGPDT